MRIFVNDIPVDIVKKKSILNWDHYDTIKKGDNKMTSDLDLKGDILFVDLSKKEIGHFMHLMQDKKFQTATSVTFAVTAYKSAVKLVKQQFTIIKAAGCLVKDGENLLMIYRLGKWDLPKGKLDKGETMKECAVREVEEECNVKVALGNKICTTWHTYTRFKKRILKKTNWYNMSCLDDTKMQPQEDEGIEAVAWFSAKGITENLKTSYPSIQHVFDEYHLQS